MITSYSKKKTKSIIYPLIIAIKEYKTFSLIEEFQDECLDGMIQNWFVTFFNQVFFDK